MQTNDISILVHLVGFITGIALYAMLGVMARRGRTGAESRGGRRGRYLVDWMAAATATLGIIWNLGGLVIYGLRDLGQVMAPPWMLAVAFAALGFLPAVVIHAASRNLPRRAGSRALSLAAYGLSTIAAGAQLKAALAAGLVPSSFGLRLLSAGYGVLTGVLVVLTRRRPGWRRGLSTVALAAFAVMALHLSLHNDPGDRWWVELVGHHASILLAVAILYQNYRFALADLFLKRVLAVVALLTITAVVYLAIVAPMLVPRLAADPTDPLAVASLATLWLFVAFSYPAVRLGANRFVDQILLRRPDYRRVQASILEAVSEVEDEEGVLDATCDLLASALSAEEVSWVTADEVAAERPVVSVASREGRQAARVTVATAEQPAYAVDVGGLTGGRVLLSDDLHMLEAAGGVAGHRIDAIRLARARTEARVRENEVLQLAAEAELRALRAQVNPHFLFNALTTIGYLMRAAPERAIETLYKLTELLRAVLRRSDGRFVTLAQELEIVEAYLAIESARFEERLHVTLDVSEGLADFLVPALILQPLVENAVKHGIAPRVDGGNVLLSARVDRAAAHEAGTLRLLVSDTGVGVSPAALARRRAAGIGLSSIERRLERHFGAEASMSVKSAPGIGTSVELRLPARRSADVEGQAHMEAAS